MKTARLVKGIAEDQEVLEKLNRQVSCPRLIPALGNKLSASPSLLDKDESIGTLFNAYFNNKMTAILLMLQRGTSRADVAVSFKAIIFLDDLYHHLIRHEYQTSHARVFQWLKIFFKKYPHVKPLQIRKAVEFIGVVYGLLGLKLNPMI